MHLGEMSRWLWTWEVWVKVKSGLTARVLEDIGPQLPLVIVSDAVIRASFALQSVKMVVVMQRNDGKRFIL